MRAKLAHRPLLRSSRTWRDYFETNLGHCLDFPWQRGAEWTADDAAILGPSLQEFQLGESSEGRNLKRLAQRHAERTGDTAYASAMTLFIREEQRHARLLAEFLLIAGLPLESHTKLVGIFRFLRRLMGLELALTILVVAETVGKVYYQALRRASKSALLARICDQLLRDEVMHLRFHCERLAILRRGRWRWRNWLAQRWHSIILGGSCLAVWWKHGPAFRGGGFGFLAFWKRCRQEHRGILVRSHPRFYTDGRRQDRTHAPAKRISISKASPLLTP